MKRWFVIGVLGLVLFEIANVYFIMPLPYSQRMRSIDVAYALYTWRWTFRLVLCVCMLIGLPSVLRARRWRQVVLPVSILLAGIVAYVTNFKMAADQMFLMPQHLNMAEPTANTVEKNRLVVGVSINGDARAYPVQFIGYHHQVRDTVGGEPILVTFCTVCRTGRVFSSIIDGHDERFRLVGMDHFNAMLEDQRTGSWWRQANGEAIAGARKGTTLREIPSQQVTLALWLDTHPTSRIMQADSVLQKRYPKNFDYETGLSRSVLTGTDSVSWSDKAWVVGLTVNDQNKAYDWNQLRRERAINDIVGGIPVVVLIASDNASFFAYIRPDTATYFIMRGDSLAAPHAAYSVSGRGTSGSLTRVQASQEFWHSWRTFQPKTLQY